MNNNAIAAEHWNSKTAYKRFLAPKLTVYTLDYFTLRYPVCCSPAMKFFIVLSLTVLATVVIVSGYRDGEKGEKLAKGERLVNPKGLGPRKIVKNRGEGRKNYRKDDGKLKAIVEKAMKEGKMKPRSKNSKAVTHPRGKRASSKPL